MLADAKVAVSVVPGEQYEGPRSWAERAYPKLIYFRQAKRGGHSPAWEEPQLFSEEGRAAFRSLRYAESGGRGPAGPRPPSLEAPTPSRLIGLGEMPHSTFGLTGSPHQSTTALAPVTDRCHSRRCHAGEASRVGGSDEHGARQAPGDAG
jgi:hypothetical protein